MIERRARVDVLNQACVFHSFHSRTVPAASGAAGPDAQRAAGAGPAAAASQQHRRCKQYSRECPGQHTHTHTRAAVCPPALSDRLPSTSTSTQGLANTVDQASAQFAASAVITADQLLALKTKEELGPGGGVNGVLSPSGMSTPVTGRDTVSD